MGFSGAVLIFDIWILKQYLKDNHPDYIYAVLKKTFYLWKTKKAILISKKKHI